MDGDLARPGSVMLWPVTAAAGCWPAPRPIAPGKVFATEEQPAAGGIGVSRSSPDPSDGGVRGQASARARCRRGAPAVQRSRRVFLLLLLLSACAVPGPRAATRLPIIRPRADAAHRPGGMGGMGPGGHRPASVPPPPGPRATRPISPRAGLLARRAGGRGRGRRATAGSMPPPWPATRQGAALWQEPFWSAAFISYVLRAAGIDRREFPPAASHAAYVDALIADAARFPATAPFLPRCPVELCAAPGRPALCRSRPRADPRLAGARRRCRAGSGRCIATSWSRPGRRYVEAIGGNVLDSRHPHPFPRRRFRVSSPRPAGAPAWFAIFENRLGPPAALERDLPHDRSVRAADPARRDLQEPHRRLADVHVFLRRATASRPSGTCST